MSESEITRRDFVRRAAGAVAGAAVGGAAASEAAAKRADAKAKVDPKKALNYNPRMGYRRFGKTGVMISEIGLGGHWKTPSGGRYWSSFPNDNPPAEVQKNRNEVWVKCAELGINYLDITTRGEAAIYGRCMKQTGVRLHVGYSDHILCIRNPKNRTIEKMMVEIDEGLRRLQLEQMWLWRPQALMGGGHSEAEMERVVETYHKAKKQGKVRYLGMSSHNHDFVRWVLEKWGEHFHGFVFMYTVSNEPKKSGSMFEMIAKQDVGAVGLKPFHGNSYFRAQVKEAKKKGVQPDLNAAALAGLKKILLVPQLTCTIPGMTTTAEVENNVNCSSPKGKKLARAERELVDAMARASLAELPLDYAWIREQGTFV
jgi:predicted aldo/keto reductase-like oxidoreductase